MKVLKWNEGKKKVIIHNPSLRHTRKYGEEVKIN